MCHWNVFLTIVLAVWPQTIDAQAFPNTSALPTTNLSTITPFTTSPSSAPASTPTTTTSPSSSPITTPVPTTPSTPPTNSTSITPLPPSPSTTSPSSSQTTTPVLTTPSTPPTNSTTIKPLPPSPSTAPVSTSTPPTSPPSSPTTTSANTTPSTPPTNSTTITPLPPYPSTTSPSSSQTTTPVPTTPSTPPTNSTTMKPPPSPSTAPVSTSTLPTSQSSSPTTTPAHTTPSTPPKNSTTITPLPPSPSTAAVSTPTPPNSPSSSPTTTPAPTTPSTPAPKPVWTLDNDRISLEWEATSTGTVIVEAEEGYKIAVKVLKCEMDGEHREYISIGPGEAGKGVQFSYTIKRQPSYLFNTNLLYVEFNGTNSTFRANFSRIGEALTTTTTEITTSTQFLPTPGINDSAVISVFVSGRRPAEYKDEKVLNLFREAVRKMATEYCFNQNFDLKEDITINNVRITRLMPCHTSWPGYETCAQITFGVPVYQNEDTLSTWQGYQLDSNHLSIMWNRYHKKYMGDDINTFDVPDSNSWVKWQIIVFCGTTVVFLVFLLVLKYFCEKFSRGINSDDMEAIIPISNEDNEVSLKPHYIQQLPPLFENTYQDITPGLPPIINADIRDGLLENEDTDEPKIDLTEDLGESGA